MTINDVSTKLLRNIPILTEERNLRRSSTEKKPTPIVNLFAYVGAMKYTMEIMKMYVSALIYTEDTFLSKKFVTKITSMKSHIGPSICQNTVRLFG